jgi:hypothetical protein
MLTTNINIRISDTRAQSVRKRVSIPHTDLWTQDWWDAQQNPSASVRRLIHDDVAANGISDVSNRLSTSVPSATATAPAAAAPVAPVAPVVPVAPVAPAVDPRDAEIAELRERFAEVHEEFAATRGEFAAMQEKFAPLMPFFTVLVEGKAA